MNKAREKFLQEYAAHYARVNEDPEALSRDSARYFDALLGQRLDRTPPDAELLDFGCGSGVLLEWLVRRKLRAVGVDASPSQVDVVRRRLPNVEVHCSDGRAFLSENVGRFSAVLAFDVLEHIDSLDSLVDCLKVINDTLAPGGFLFCRVPNGANLFAGYSRYLDITHHRLFTSSSLHQVLVAAGFAGTEIVPIRGGGSGSRARIATERAIHKLLFRLTGRSGESVFTSNICAIAWKRDSQE